GGSGNSVQLLSGRGSEVSCWDMDIAVIDPQILDPLPIPEPVQISKPRAPAVKPQKAAVAVNPKMGKAITFSKNLGRRINTIDMSVACFKACADESNSPGYDLIRELAAFDQAAVFGISKKLKVLAAD